MLQLKHLTITHKKGLTTLVDDLSFVLAPGDRAALIGEEGSGKSTVPKLPAPSGRREDVTRAPRFHSGEAVPASYQALGIHVSIIEMTFSMASPQSCFSHSATIPISP